MTTTGTAMEVDTEASAAAVPSAPPPLAEEKVIKIHPLAIIGLSDHHTRVVTGGSALPRDAPVVGLLFGYINGWTIVIVDAEEMEHPGGDFSATTNEPAYDHRAGVLQKIELHQKVFPKHEVVGWYRVQRKGSGDAAAEEGPSEEDLQMNQTEVKHYCGESVDSPLFILMNAAAPEESGSKKPAAAAAAPSVVTRGVSASETLDNDELLPLTLYETLVTEGSAVFVNVDFELDTFEPERIAVEKVFKTQPSQQTAASSKDTAAREGAEPRKAGKKSKKVDQASDASSAPPPSELDIHLDALRSSIKAMNIRVEVLLEFLRKVERGDLPPDDALLRTVDGLVRQLPFVMGALEESSASSLPSSSSGRRPAGELEDEYDDTMLLSYLATVAKTALTIQGYTEKYRIAHESNSREMRPRGSTRSYGIGSLY